MAGLLGLSPYHFARMFRRAVGVPPHQYVLQRRVERAKGLLLAGRLGLSDVALAVGFSDQSHLTRVFRRAVGITPARFRRAG
jgi:AraC family transcriptional regulator